MSLIRSCNHTHRDLAAIETNLEPTSATAPCHSRQARVQKVCCGGPSGNTQALGARIKNGFSERAKDILKEDLSDGVMIEVFTCAHTLTHSPCVRRWRAARASTSCTHILTLRVCERRLV